MMIADNMMVFEDFAGTKCSTWMVRLFYQWLTFHKQLPTPTLPYQGKFWEEKYYLVLHPGGQKIDDVRMHPKVEVTQRPNMISEAIAFPWVLLLQASSGMEGLLEAFSCGQESATAVPDANDDTRRFLLQYQRANKHP